MIQKRTTEPSKNSVHAPWIHAAGILTALWLMIVFLITAVEAVAYWTPGYYKMEYEKYQVLDDLPEMTMDDLLSVTDEMMAYLRGNREDLHVFTTMGGEYREFFNAREIAHMEDVRGLFLGGLWLRRIGLMFTLAFAALLYFWKRGRIVFISGNGKHLANVSVLGRHGTGGLALLKGLTSKEHKLFPKF